VHCEDLLDVQFFSGSSANFLILIAMMRFVAIWYAEKILPETLERPQEKIIDSE